MLTKILMKALLITYSRTSANHHLSTTSTSLQRQRPLMHVPNYQPLNNGQFFERLMKKSRMVTNWSVRHVYDQSQQSYFDFVSFIQLRNCEPCLFCHISILIHDIIQASCVLSLQSIYDWITMIMGYSKHELSTKKTCCTPSKIVI